MVFNGRAKDLGGPVDTLTGTSFCHKMQEKNISDRIWNSTAQHQASKALADALRIFRSQSQENTH